MVDTLAGFVVLPAKDDPDTLDRYDLAVATVRASKVTALEQLTESHEVQMAQAMVDNITRQLADIVSATRELDADCYAQRIRSYLMFSEPQMSFMQRYNVKRSVMLAALVCAVCYLGAVVQACVRRQRQRMENE